MAHNSSIVGSISNGEQNDEFIDEKVVKHYLITWTIDNFHLLRESPISLVSSPPFHLNNESWTITLDPDYSNCGAGYMKLCLIRGKNLDGAIHVTFRFGIKTNTTTWFGEKRQIRFYPSDKDFTVYDVYKYCDNLNALRENVQTILCEMYVGYTTDLPLFTCKTDESFELYILSSDTFRAFGSLQDSDVLIRGKRLDSIPAHKAILSSRSPGFNRMLDETCTSIIIPEEDCDHIHNILVYIYSGRFKWITAIGVSIGFYECAVKYEVRGLVQLLTPSEISISTTVTEQVIQYTWNIDKFSSYEKKINECITSPPFNSGIKDSLLWYLDIYPEGTCRAPNRVGIFVRNSSMNPIPLNIYVSIVDEFNREHLLRNTNEPLEPNFLYGFLNYTTKELLDKKGLLKKNKLIVRCKIVCKTAIYSYDKGNVTCQSPFLEYTSLEQLSADFQKLLEDGNFANGTLVANEDYFFMHKVILHMRFPVFAKLLKVSNKDEVEVTDVSPEVLEAILFYAYTGKLKTYNNVSLINDIYSTAKTYEMLSLAGACAKALRSYFFSNISFYPSDKEEGKHLAKKKCMDFC